MSPIPPVNRQFLVSFILVLATLGSGASWLRAQDAPARPAATNALPAFSLKAVREGPEAFGPIQRAYVTLGTNRAAFLIPRGYEVHTDLQRWRVTFTAQEGRATVAVQFYSPPQTAQGQAASPATKRELKPESCLPIILQRHPNAKVTEQFTATASGVAGPGFDLNLPGVTGVGPRHRFVFLPALTGLVEFQASGDDASIEEARSALNSILLTFKVAENGKLDIAPISDKI